MTASKAKAEAAKPDVPETDAKGFVTIEKQGIVAKVLPSSVRVWAERGWTVAKDDVDPIDADPFESTDPDQSQEG